MSFEAIINTEFYRLPSMRVYGDEPWNFEQLGTREREHFDLLQQSVWANRLAYYLLMRAFQEGPATNNMSLDELIEFASGLLIGESRDFFSLISESFWEEQSLCPPEHRPKNDQVHAIIADKLPKIVARIHRVTREVNHSDMTYEWRYAHALAQDLATSQKYTQYRRKSDSHLY